jgi:hypothetical protein
MTVSMPVGVERALERRERKTSMLEGRAVMRAVMGRGLAGAEGPAGGRAVPEGRAAIGGEEDDMVAAMGGGGGAVVVVFRRGSGWEWCSSRRKWESRGAVKGRR